VDADGKRRKLGRPPDVKLLIDEVMSFESFIEKGRENEKVPRICFSRAVLFIYSDSATGVLGLAGGRRPGQREAQA
jgi:hypothetical protein